jgi:hypothetical protein
MKPIKGLPNVVNGIHEPLILSQQLPCFAVNRRDVEPAQARTHERGRDHSPFDNSGTIDEGQVRPPKHTDSPRQTTVTSFEFCMLEHGSYESRGPYKLYQKERWT